jgi:tRNA pseudouridine38-40 synthase
LYRFHSFYQQIDSFRSNFFLWITPGGIAAAKLRQGFTEEDAAEDEKLMNKQLGDEDDEDVNPEEGEG